MNRYFKLTQYIVAKKNLKHEKFSENNNKTNIFNFRKRFSIYFKLLINILLLFADSIEIFHRVLFTSQ